MRRINYLSYLLPTHDVSYWWSKNTSSVLNNDHHINNHCAIFILPHLTSPGGHQLQGRGVGLSRGYTAPTIGPKMLRLSGGDDGREVMTHAHLSTFSPLNTSQLPRVRGPLLRLISIPLCSVITQAGNYNTLQAGKQRHRHDSLALDKMKLKYNNKRTHTASLMYVCLCRGFKSENTRLIFYKNFQISFFFLLFIPFIRRWIS